jgi:hypothetical protein
VAKVLVILEYYALYFVFAALVLAFPDRWLLAGAVAALPGGALVYLLTETALPEWFGAYPATLGDPAGRILRDLLLSGAYPLATWGRRSFSDCGLDAGICRPRDRPGRCSGSQSP